MLPLFLSDNTCQSAITDQQVFLVPVIIAQDKIAVRLIISIKLIC
jgi:hypothetical protein